MYEVEIAGVVDDGLTSALISTPELGHIAQVFELADGWYVHTDRLERLADGELRDSIILAQAKLRHYVNRRGGHAPQGMSRAAYSLWLMERDDGQGFSAP